MAINEHTIPGILFVTSYPPRECGIATYSQDLIKALNNKFDNSFSISICALESEKETHSYPEEVKFVLNTSDSASYSKTADDINKSPEVQLVMIQHEFGFFSNGHEDDFNIFLSKLKQPIIITFHTVLPGPNDELLLNVQILASYCHSIVVMTKNAASTLARDYSVPTSKISIIPHGVHLVPHSNKKALKEKYGLSGRTILSTFGLIGPGKSIETSLKALPAIIENNSDVLFLIIGKTHPNIVKQDGEVYRQMLEEMVEDLGVRHHVRFINSYLPLETLLEYLQLTDIYLFTSKDPNQAVSGTFSYAISCGCPIISTPIPHAKEVLGDDAGIIFDFQDSAALATTITLLLNNEGLTRTLSTNGLQRIVPSVWENVSLTHANLFKKTRNVFNLDFKIPEINLAHIKHLSTPMGIIQFAKIDQPDISSGYTLDDNVRALIALVMTYKLKGNDEVLPYITTYLNFIKHCQQENGSFLNYVDEHGNFTLQNQEANLEDSNGRAIWALGLTISHRDVLPEPLIHLAIGLFKPALENFENIHSTRAMAFALKGLFYYNENNKDIEYRELTDMLAQRLVQMYKHEGELEWEWFESYLTYGNSILPESLLCAYQITGNLIYKEIAQASMAFLLSRIFNDDGIKVISNKHWLMKGEQAGLYGEQPIDVAYTVLALDRFYKVFKNLEYLEKLAVAFNWFLGSNHLQQIIYNPCTGGCYDGLEEFQINLNQGAESTVSYLMARLTMEEYISSQKLPFNSLNKEVTPV